MLAVGLWWFAWTIPGTQVKVVAWPASAVSLILLGYGLNESSTVLPRYVLESHKSTNDAASAFTAMLTVRALLSAVFPLFTQQMFENLGNGSAGSILAAIATALCLLPLILVKFGARLRGNGPSGDIGDEESGQEAQVEKKAKAKKTVRWGNETDSSSTDGSETTKSVDPGDSDSGSGESSDGISRTETETETEARSEDDGSDTSRVETRIARRDFAASAAVSRVDDATEGEGGSGSAEMARVETEGSGCAGGKGKKKKEKEKEKEIARVDTKDNGAAGYLGMDVERLAVFPYF